MTDRRIKPFGLLLALVLVLPVVGCNTDDDPDESVDFVSELTLEDGQGSTEDSFTVGANATVVLSVRNRTDESQRLTFSDERTTDFAVLDNDGDIVRIWSSDKSFADVTTDVNFNAGETRRFTMNWTGLDDDSGRSLPAGQYEVQAWMATDDEDGVNDLTPGSLRSTLVPFEITAP